MFDLDSTQNPGLQLQLILKDLFPVTTVNRADFVAKMDDLLYSEGEFSSIVYDSCINYMVRRLITTSEYYKRQYDPTVYPSDRYVQEIRRFLQQRTKIPHNRREQILSLLLQCLQERAKYPTPKAKSTLRAKTKEQGLYCYICGREINFEDDTAYNAFDAEHVWPRTLGGKNDATNLAGVCRRCNQEKENYIDYADFHYEEMCLVSHESEQSFSNEFKWGYRVALSAKSSFRCVICDQPAAYVGELKFARRDRDDSWHFLNIDAYCAQHAP